MNNTKRNTQPTRNSNSLKEKKMPDADQHELFVQWLTMLLRDDHGRAVIREMVEQNEMPVIDDSDRRSVQPRYRVGHP
jgi:hypothetical protein